MKKILKINYFLAGLCFWFTLGIIGHWRVYYLDCKRYSVRMDYFTARNYAKIFKGLIVWDWK